MRVNARFEGAAEQQVTYLATSTGLKVSDVLRESVAFYYHHVRAGSGQLRHLSKLLGKGNSGRSDIAANVKHFVSQDLNAKYPAKPAGGRAGRPARAPKSAE